MELPPQPTADDFIDDNGSTRMCYYDALAAWKAVCLAIAWNEPCPDCHPKPAPAVQWAEGLKLRAALEKMLASAVPNPKEHPSMFAAWAEARALLARIDESAALVSRTPAARQAGTPEGAST